MNHAQTTHSASRTSLRGGAEYPPEQDEYVRLLGTRDVSAGNKHYHSALSDPNPSPILTKLTISPPQETAKPTPAPTPLPGLSIEPPAAIPDAILQHLPDSEPLLSISLIKDNWLTSPDNLQAPIDGFLPLPLTPTDTPTIRPTDSILQERRFVDDRPTGRVGGSSFYHQTSLPALVSSDSTPPAETRHHHSSYKRGHTASSGKFRVVRSNAAAASTYYPPPAPEDTETTPALEVVSDIPVSLIKDNWLTSPHDLPQPPGPLLPPPETGHVVSPMVHIMRYPNMNVAYLRNLH